MGVVAMLGAMLAGGGDDLDADYLDGVGDANAADAGGGHVSEECPVTGAPVAIAPRARHRSARPPSLRAPPIAPSALDRLALDRLDRRDRLSIDSRQTLDWRSMDSAASRLQAPPPIDQLLRPIEQSNTCCGRPNNRTAAAGDRTARGC